MPVRVTMPPGKWTRQQPKPRRGGAAKEKPPVRKGEPWRGGRGAR